jgi:hypothetical protein
MQWPLPRLTLVAVLGLIVVGFLRIVSTYRTFSQTVDEPSHMAGGLEWLDRGTYWFEPKHPPLARVAFAVGPYLAGLRISDSMPTGRVHFGRVFREGNALLETKGRYDRNLALARLGNLPFFMLGCLAVFWLAAPLFGTPAAIGAVAFASTSPMILAHSGVATTDMALAATLTLALLTIIRYLARPGPRSAAMVGAAVALPLLTKLSTVLFLPAAGVVIVILAILSQKGPDRPLSRVRVSHLALMGATAFLLMWAVYRFSVGTPLEVDQRLTERLANAFGSTSGLARSLTTVAHLRVVPAVEWFAGVKDLVASNQDGTKGYLLGKVFIGGNPLHFPVGLIVKTPLPLLLLEIGGLAMAWASARRTRNWMLLAPAAAAGAILATTIPSQINIGMRHVLPVFLLLTPYAGVAAARLLSPASTLRARGLGIVLALWYTWSSVRVHPDYLSYFNELAVLSRQPVLVNSDLDWGQDAKRLVRTVQELRLDSLHVGYFGSTDLVKRGMEHFDTLADYTPVSGWVAISINRLLLGRALETASDQFAWLKAYQPSRKVGQSILLYRIPPP